MNIKNMSNHHPVYDGYKSGGRKQRKNNLKITFADEIAAEVLTQFDQFGRVFGKLIPSGKLTARP